MNSSEILNANKNEKIPSPKSKKKHLRLIVFMIVLIITMGAGYLFYSLYYTNPQKVIASSFKALYKEVTKMVQEANDIKFDYNLRKNTLSLESDLDINLKVNDITYDPMNINFNAGVDYPNKKLIYNLGIGDNNQNIINLVFAAIKNKSYIKSDKLYGKTILLDDTDKIEFNKILEEAFESNGDISLQESLNIWMNYLKLYGKLTFKYLDSKVYSKQVSNVTINNTYKLNKYTVSISTKEAKVLTKKIYAEILNNEEYFNIYYKFEKLDNPKYTKDEIRKNLKDEIDSINDLNKKDEYTHKEISIYTKGFLNEFVGIEFKADNNIAYLYNIEDELSIYYKNTNNSFKFNGTEKDKIIKGAVYYNNDKLGSLTIAGYNSDKLNIVFEGINKEIIAFKMQGKIINDQAIFAGYTLSYKDDKYDINIKLKIKKILDQTINVIGIDENNAIKLDDMREEDIMNAYNNFNEIIGNSVYYKLFTDFITVIYDSTPDISLY